MCLAQVGDIIARMFATILGHIDRNNNLVSYEDVEAPSDTAPSASPLLWMPPLSPSFNPSLMLNVSPLFSPPGDVNPLPIPLVMLTHCQSPWPSPWPSPWLFPKLLEPSC